MMAGLLLLLLLLAPAFGQKKPITLETLNLPPRRDTPGPAVWAPNGKMFAYEQGDKLMIYNPARKSSRMVVSTEAMSDAAVKVPDNGPAAWQDRYVREAGLQWSPSGKDLLYAAGGDLFLIHADNGKWEQLTATAAEEQDPKFSPDGKSISFRRGFDLYARDIATGKETRLTTGGSGTLRNGGLDWVYPEEIGLDTAYWWAPDSRSIAYLQFDVSREPLYPHEDLLKARAVFEPERYPQAGENNADVHLGVVAATGGATRWLEIGDTRNAYVIARAGWAPDSKSVYVIRTSRLQNRVETFLINVESGTSSAVSSESDPYWINIDGDITFLNAGAQFLWTSERDGFRHIYLFSIDGRSVKQLTRGPWEVKEVVGVDEAGGRIFYTSDEGDSLETHFYSVGLDGENKRRLDSAPGTHHVSMGAGGAYYLDTYSNLTSPPRTTVHSGAASDQAGRELAVFHEADRTRADEYEILPTEVVSFRGPDGTLLHGRVIKPAGFDAGRKYPAIMTVYGGPGVELPIRNSWPGINLDQVYAHRGFVIWESENRGGLGRGHAFETPVYHNLGATELADQLAGVQYLISLGFVDAQRIGVRGWSYGGFMTLNALLNSPDTFRCGIAGAPVTSWLNYDTIYTERYMGLPDENPDGYRNSTLPLRAKNLKARLMIVHNLEDDNVLFQNSLQMIHALEQAGKEFDFMLYPQKTHNVSGAAMRQMNASMLDFFERNLK
jgi:dipeptidyl-peptidase 4